MKPLRPLYKPFHINLSDAERDRLERHREAQGKRSQADVVRGWIAGAVVAKREWEEG